MRILLLTLLAGGLAAENFPVLTVTYGGDGPAPVEPVAGWWREAVDEAAAGFGGDQQTAAPVIADCRGLRLVGVGVAGGQSGPTPWAAGWWQSAPPALAGALHKAVAEWPGYVAVERDGRLHLAAPGIVSASDDAPPAGWRATLHGVAVMRSLEAVVPVDVLQPWRAVLTAITRHDLVAAVEPDRRAWLASGLPARWFTPPDAEVVARLPASALATAVVGVDGAALAIDLAALAGPLPEALDDLERAAGSDLAGLARALTGTWAYALTGPQQHLVIMPRSAPLDRLFAAEATVAIPEDGTPIMINQTSVARTARWWLVADQARAITAFLAAPVAGPANASDAVGWVHITESAALALAGLPGEVLAQWPLPSRLLGWPSALAAPVATTFGLPAPTRGWNTAIGLLAGSGDHRLDLRADGGRIRADLHGPLLPWLVPGAALRWFTDHAQDLAGRARLRQQITAWRAAGIGALPDDLAALVAPVGRETIASTLTLYGTLSAGPQMPTQEDPWRLARLEFLPIVRPAPAPWLDTLSKLLIACEGLPMSGSALSVRHAESTGTLGPAMANPHLAVAVRLAKAGRTLAAFADPAGIELADRALLLVDAPLSLAAELIRHQVRALRDDAWLAAAIAGVVPPASIAAWAAEPTPAPDPRCWQGERLLVAWGSAAWLDLPTAAPAGDQDWTRLVAAPAIWQPHIVRAVTAADHAALGDLLLRRERGDETLAPGWQPPQSTLVLKAITAQAPMRSAALRMASRHALVRLAWRLHQLAQKDALPADALAAAAAVGPLTVPYGGATLPLTFSRHGSGFQLRVDTSGEPPAAMEAAEWKRLKARKPADPSTRFQLLTSAVVLSPAATAEPAAVDGSF